MKIEVKRKKAKCPKCGEFVKMTYNGNIDQYEFSCCEKTYTLYKKITKIDKRRRKEK